MGRALGIQTRGLALFCEATDGTLLGMIGTILISDGQDSHGVNRIQWYGIGG